VIEILSYIGLAFGFIFFLYALRYYAALCYISLILLRARNGNGNGNGANGNHANGGFVSRFPDNYTNHANGSGLKRVPFVSIHVPLYNEENVVDRLMEALTSLDYPNYEIIVVDDSTDNTTSKLKKWTKHQNVKVIHRDNREGFKGGALNEALKHMSRDADYVVVFDADFIPPRDVIWRLLHAFKNGFVVNNNGNKLDSWVRDSDVVAVQGYQWHILNASENWITRVVSAEYAGNYLVERVFANRLPGVRMIAGSVFMIRADILRRYGWRGCLTEDWDLTLRLYRDGYKVEYTPMVAAPAECPSTLGRLMRQRARWAEGHTYAVKRYFMDILRSRFLSFREKLEFLYLTPYYMSSIFLLVGTISWILAELLGARIPFWTAVFGWSLLLTNLIAIPLVNLTGLFLEYRASKGILGVIGFIPLMHALVVSQAIASLKGLVEKRESAWFRTLKTGKITEPQIFFKIRKALLGGLQHHVKKERKTERESKIFRFIPFIITGIGLLAIWRTYPLAHEPLLPMIGLAAGLAILAMTTTSFKLKNQNLIKLTTLISITFLITTLATTPTPTQANVIGTLGTGGGATLYFHPSPGSPAQGECQISSGKFITYGYLKTTLPSNNPNNYKVINPNDIYCWVSDQKYYFGPQDAGTWILHLEYNEHSNSRYLDVSILISPDQTDVGDIIWSGQVELPANTQSLDEYIEVTPADCLPGCYVQVMITNLGSPVVRLYQGANSRYSYLLIPENVILVAPAFLVFTFFFSKTMSKKRRKRVSSDYAPSPFHQPLRRLTSQKT